MKIVIGTNNPGKIEGAKQAFEQYFSDVVVEGITVESGVSEEPVNEEIGIGAKNRIKNIKAKQVDADFYIAVESGITNKLGEWMIINIAVIEDKEGKQSMGCSQGFPVPAELVTPIIETDLGTVMDAIFRQKELRKGKGGIHFLTHDKVTRIDLTKQAFTMALTRFINPNIWE